MSQENSTFRALAVLREQIVREKDPAKLRELLLEINCLLTLIETQASKLESRKPPRLN